MTDCRNCAKIFCKNRDNVYECNEKITFVQAGALEQPLYLIPRGLNSEKPRRVTETIVNAEKEYLKYLQEEKEG